MRMVPLQQVVGSQGLICDGDWVESKDQDPDGDVRLLQLADIGIGKFLNKSSRFLTSESAKKLKCTYLEKNDILIARMPDPIGRACIFPGQDSPCVTVVDICILRPDKKQADVNYLKWAINSIGFLNGIEKHIKGSTRQRVSRKNLEQILIALPPLEEQKRIAAILDQADALRRQRQRALDRLNQLAQAIFYEMFGDPLTSNVNLRPLASVATLINGRAYSKHEEREEGTPVIRIQNLNGGSRWFYSDMQLPEDKYCIEGDLLFAWSATFGPYIWEGPKAIYHYHIWKIELTDHVTKEYFYWLLKIISDDVKRGGRGISMTHATKGGMDKRLLPIPSKEEQIEFSKLVNEINAQVQNHKNHLDALNHTFNSLQHRAFRGEL